MKGETGVAIELIRSGDYITNPYGYKEFLLDGVSDIELLYEMRNDIRYSAGSKAYVIGDGDWIFSNYGEWKKISSQSSGQNSPNIKVLNSPKTFILNTVANFITKITFDVTGYEFLVINNTEKEMFVAFKEEYLTPENRRTKAWYLPPDSNRTCTINRDSTIHTSSEIYVLSGVTIENGLIVECTRFKEDLND